MVPLALFLLVLTQVKVLVIVAQLGSDPFLILSDCLGGLELIHWIGCLSEEDFGMYFVRGWRGIPRFPLNQRDLFEFIPGIKWRLDLLWDLVPGIKWKLDLLWVLEIVFQKDCFFFSHCL